MASFVALYSRPADVDAFEAHYRDTHLPLLRRWPDVAEARVTRLTATPRGGDPAYHLMAEVRFASVTAMQESLRSDVARATGKDAMEMCRRFGCEATMVLGEEFT